MRKKPGKWFKVKTIVVVPTPAVRECQDPEHGCSPAFGKAVTSCHCSPQALWPTQVHQPVGWGRMQSSVGRQREDCQPFPKESHSHVSSKASTPMWYYSRLHIEWSLQSYFPVTLICHMGSIFCIQVSQSMLIIKSVHINSQQSRKLSNSSKAQAWHIKLWVLLELSADCWEGA